MNAASLPQLNEERDTLRPPEEFWGPVVLRDSAGQLRDAVEPQAIPHDIIKPTACPICAETNHPSLGIIYGYPIYHCLGCDAGFAWPQSDADKLKAFYGPRYWANYLQDSRTIYERPELCKPIYARQADWLDRLLKHQYDSRILDVGAGDGTMLRLMKDRGYRDVYGLDLDARNCQRAREQLGVPVEHNDFLSYPQKGWDVITLWAVIEHLTDPAAFVAQAYRLLKPGGKLVIMTGDNASACARLQGCFDMWLYPPEHLFYFGKKSLTKLLQQHHFQQVGVRVGFQHPVKETILSARRMLTAVKDRYFNKTPPRWRSTASNLLVAWGTK
ncbi:MAG: class I SAM-dependent methyltransferase [Planctomycetia bacterium]|nr:class I SAM-dependent methyltransferase [Planctomycetia bacterium]